MFAQAKLAQHGMRNSLLLAPMPTASTAQILGNNESVEPFTRYEQREGRVEGRGGEREIWREGGREGGREGARE